jgi:hypothetical protein
MEQGDFLEQERENGLGSNFASQMAPLDPSAILKEENLIG